MARPITLFSGQWADLPFAVLCQKARSFGFDGVELACQGEQMDARRAATDPGYVEQKKGVLREHRLQVFALGGQKDPVLMRFAVTTGTIAAAGSVPLTFAGAWAGAEIVGITSAD